MNEEHNLRQFAQRESTSRDLVHFLSHLNCTILKFHHKKPFSVAKFKSLFVLRKRSCGDSSMDATSSLDIKK